MIAYCEVLALVNFPCVGYSIVLFTVSNVSLTYRRPSDLCPCSSSTSPNQTIFIYYLFYLFIYNIRRKARQIRIKFKRRLHETTGNRLIQEAQF